MLIFNRPRPLSSPPFFFYYFLYTFFSGLVLCGWGLLTDREGDKHALQSLHYLPNVIKYVNDTGLLFRLKARCVDQELRSCELAERVTSSGKDQHTLQQQLTDTKTQLHMANIRIEQVSCTYPTSG